MIDCGGIFRIFATRYLLLLRSRETHVKLYELMEKFSLSQVLNLLDLLMGKSLVWIMDSSSYDEGDFGARYVLRVNEHLQDACICNVRELSTADHLLLDANDWVDDDEDEAVMHLIFDDGHEDKIFFDMVLLDAV